jgi:outer membrane lipoprotein-sorting protein
MNIGSRTMSELGLPCSNVARALRLVAFCVASASAQEPDLSVDQIVQKHIAALGGAEKLNAIQNVTMTGTASLMDGQLQAPVTVRAKRPMSMRMEMSLQGQTFIQAFDGKTAWMINPFIGSAEPKKSSEEDTRTARDDADFIEGSLVDYKAKGNTVELAGKEDVDGPSAYKLKVTRKSGSIENIYLDAKTYLPLKSSGTRQQQDHEIAYESLPGNYKPVNGVMMPFSLNQKMNGRSMMELTVEKVEVNTSMDDSIFQMPQTPSPKK